MAPMFLLFWLKMSKVKLFKTKDHTRVSMEVIVTIASKLVYKLFRGLTTYKYRAYNLVTNYHVDASTLRLLSFFSFSP